MPTRFRPGRLLAVMTAITMLAFGAPDANAFTDELERDTVGDMSQHSSRDPIKEIFHVHGDAPDPEGAIGKGGLAPGYELTKHAIGRPMVYYQLPGGSEIILEIDVYQIPGEPMRLHLLCPHCLARDHGNRNALNISAAAKQMSYEPSARVPTYPGWTDAQMAHAFPNGAGGLLSVTRFRCSWEVDERYRMAIGNICDFEVAIDKNVAKPVARVTRGSLLGKIRSP